MTNVNRTHAISPDLPERTRVARSRGAVTGLLLVLLGIWGAIIPFIGPAFGYAFTPAGTWQFTMGRLWLEILPGVAVFLGGLLLLLSAHRAVALFGAWLAVLGGAWFVLGTVLSTLWNNGQPAAGTPTGPDTLHKVAQQIGFFTGLGVVVLVLAAFALGRMSVVGLREVRRAQRSLDQPEERVGEQQLPHPAEQHVEPAADQPASGR